MTDTCATCGHFSDAHGGGRCNWGGCDCAAGREAQNIADTVLALADDMLKRWPPDEGGDPSIDEVYDWLVAQARKIGEEVK